jgi:hypothetical protein
MTKYRETNIKQKQFIPQGPHGIIQGYNGIAVANTKNKIIVAADVDR